MQVIIVEPLLRNQSGHQFAYTLALQSELEKRKISVLILGNISADESCLKINNFYPCLTDVTSEVFKITPTIRGLFNIYKLIRLLRDQLDSFFLSQSDFKIQRGSIYFLHSLYIPELLSFGWFLKKRAKIFIDNGYKVFLGFNFTYKRRSLITTLIFKFLYKYIFTALIKNLRSQIIYFSDGEISRRDYERLLKTKVYLLPPPINNQFMEYYIHNPEQNIYKERIIISYMGGTRYNKGFDIFVKMLVKFLNEEIIAERIVFSIQIDIHRQQSNKDKKTISEAIKLLKNLTNKFKNIKCIYGAVSTEEYYKLLSQSDLVVLPYREEAFRSLPSNIFREAVVLGKIPIVSSNTTMSHDLVKYNLDDLIFAIKDIESFIDVIKKVVNNIDAYKTKIDNLQKGWLNFYSATNLVNQLLILAS